MCTKRWRRVYRLLKSWGRPVQYSVFACYLRDGELRAVMQALAEVIDPAEDRVHLWLVCGQCQRRMHVLGRGGRIEPLPAVWVVSEE